jgi:membrane-associated protein
MNFDAAHIRQIAESLGVWAHPAIWAIIFAESGLVIGVLLPGDSLLFTAGFLASPNINILNIQFLLVGCLIAAVLGDNVGYAMGHRWGRQLFQRSDSRFFHKKHLIAAQKFYELHGKKAVVLARFMPFVRTFAPIVAGIGSMHYRTFMMYNLVGGIAWTFGITLLGYSLGKVIPPDDIDKYLLPIILLVIVVSLLPSLWHFYQERKSTHR